MTLIRLDHARQGEPRPALMRVRGALLGCPERFKRSSFSHQNQFQPTRIDRVPLETVNRPVPCKHKGIRQFSEIFGVTRVKARTLQGVAGSNPARGGRILGIDWFGEYLITGSTSRWDYCGRA